MFATFSRVRRRIMLGLLTLCIGWSHALSAADWTAYPAPATAVDFYAVWHQGAIGFAVGSGGAIERFDGAIWTSMPAPTPQALRALWGSSATQVFAVGDLETIVRYDGNAWSVMRTNTTGQLKGIWGASPTDVFTVGLNGQILHFNGTAWQPMISGTTETLNAVWGRSGTDVFALGNGSTVLHYDGINWAPISLGTLASADLRLTGLWGDAANVFVTGLLDSAPVETGGLVLRYNNNTWNKLLDTVPRLRSLWGRSSADVFAVGEAGAAMHYNGTAWQLTDTASASQLFSVYGDAASGNILAVGNGSTRLRYAPGTTVTPPPTTVVPPARQIAAGDLHSCALKNDGSPVCWGNNEHGEITAPAGLFTQIAAGGSHTCALKSDGGLVCWGGNSNDETSPPAGNFIQVTLGKEHSCGLKGDGSLACWGANLNGQTNAPAGTFTQVAAGRYHTCALKTDGNLLCWGLNDNGQASPPAGVFTQVTAGHLHTCALKSDGSALCWGLNDEGQASPPAGVFVQFDAGNKYNCALQSDGKLVCWGRNTMNQATPPGGNFIQVSAGFEHACALQSDGAIACWGNNSFGQASPPVTPPPTGATQYSLTTAVAGQGSVTGAGSYPTGSKAVLQATPATGWLFANWGGDCQGAVAQPSIEVVLDRNKNCVANFTQPTAPVTLYKLTVNITGQGTVTGAGQYHATASAILQATPADGWAFFGWSGDCLGGPLQPRIGVVLNQDKTCAAEFTQSVNLFKLTVNVTGQGRVDGPRQAPPGNTLLLNAVRAPGWLFKGWSGDCNANGLVLMNADKTCAAEFIPEAILPTNAPTPLQEMGVSSFTQATPEIVNNTPPLVFSRLGASEVAALPPTAFQAASAAHLANLSPQAVRGITPAQMQDTSATALSALDAPRLQALPPTTVRVIKPIQLRGVNNTEFHTMPTQHVAGFMTNLDSAQIKPDDVIDLLPDGWLVDLSTGDLTAPPGSRIQYRPQPQPVLPPQLKVAELPDLSTGFGVGGVTSKGSALTNLQSTLDASIGGFRLEQGSTGVLRVSATANSRVSLSYMPDPQQITLLDSAPGLALDQGGFPLLTTATGERFRVIPAPHDPTALPQALGTNSLVDVTEDGSVMLKYSDTTRRNGEARQVVLFQAWVEPAPEAFYCMAYCGSIPSDDISADLLSQLPSLIGAGCTCDGSQFNAALTPGLHLPSSTGRRIAISLPHDTRNKAHFVYPDGTSQKLDPAFLEPDKLLALLQAFDGMEATYNANGTFSLKTGGLRYVVRANFDVIERLSESAPESPEIQVNNDVLEYVVPYEDTTDSSARRSARQVLVFSPILEYVPEEFCSYDLIPSRFICTFDGQYCEETSAGEWACELSLDSL